MAAPLQRLPGNLQARKHITLWFSSLLSLFPLESWIIDLIYVYIWFLCGNGCLKLVIDFSASWCGPCKFMEPAFNDMAAKLTDVDFVKIDVDELSVRSVPSDSLYFFFSLFLDWFCFFPRLQRMLRRNSGFRRCRRSCCWSKGRKWIGLSEPRRRSWRRRLRNIARIESMPLNSSSAAAVVAAVAAVVRFSLSYSLYSLYFINACFLPLVWISNFRV